MRRASSAGAVSIGQWPVSMSTSERFLICASSGSSPWLISSLIWAGVNSGQISTAGTA